MKIHRDSQASQLSTALDARSFTHGGEIFLPDSHGPLTSGTGKALLAHELTHVSQQRRLGHDLPAEDTPHGKSLEREAVAAERSPEMPLAMPQRGNLATSPNEADSAPVPAAPAVHGAGPQRAPDEGTPKMTLEIGRGTLLDAGQQPRKKAGAKQGHSEQELEVLAHQLYHRIGRHLRRELLVDRERMGFALDLP